MVQTTKRCLRKVLGKAKLNYEELYTILKEIEAVVNSRPLCYIYDNAVLDDVITPSHMLMGRRLLSVAQDGADPENVEFSHDSISKRCLHITTSVHVHHCLKSYHATVDQLDFGHRDSVSTQPSANHLLFSIHEFERMHPKLYFD